MAFSVVENPFTSMSAEKIAQFSELIADQDPVRGAMSTISILPLFSGSRNEELRVRAFNRACEDNGTAFFHSIRDKAIRAICDGNHVKLFEAVHSRLNFTAEDLQEQAEGRYSLLWRACDLENPELVGHFLGIEGISDVSGPDGMTAFALALGHQNICLVRQFLQSNPSPRAKTLARKVLQAASPEQPLKNAIQEILEMTSTLPHGHTELNSILLENTWKYPLFNDGAEGECEVV